MAPDGELGQRGGRDALRDGLVTVERGVIARRRGRQGLCRRLRAGRISVHGGWRVLEMARV